MDSYWFGAVSVDAIAASADSAVSAALMDK